MEIEIAVNKAKINTFLVVVIVISPLGLSGLRGHATPRAGLTLLPRAAV
jgi:hypothetical protein